MPNSSTGNAANAAKGLLNQAQGFAGPGSPIMTGFRNSLGTAQGRQSDLYSGATGNIQDLKNLASTGGYDPVQFNQTLSGYNDLATTGGYDPVQFNQTLSGYNDLATTGGYTPQQASQVLQRGTEGTQSTYGALQDQAKRASIATGGLGTTGGLSQMARQLAQTQGQNTLNAQLG